MIVREHQVRLRGVTKHMWEAKPDEWRAGFLEAVEAMKRDREVAIISSDGVEVARR